MQLNMQPTEKADMATGPIRYMKIWQTIQGEGPFSGCSAIFIRLAGCNLQCPMCDTIYSGKDQREQDVSYIMHCIDLICDSSKSPPTLVVLTGGEPFIQNLTALVQELDAARFDVQIETNGTTFNRENLFAAKVATVVCSPKTPTINKDLYPYINAWKYIVEAGRVCERDGLPLSVLGNDLRVARWYDHNHTHKADSGSLCLTLTQRNVYIQPCDEQDKALNELNLKQAVTTVMRYGYRLCTQVHKQIGLE
jgi:7-carboxy-7-deazaguanine synthase